MMQSPAGMLGSCGVGAAARPQSTAMGTLLPAQFPPGTDEIAKFDSQDWKYEMRRDIQEILPGFWLGPYCCSKNLSLLQSRGITHVVCLRDNVERSIIRPHFPDKFQYLIIEVSDSPLENLIPHFAGARQFVEDALKCGGRVLVHCNDGISRSPAFAVAYVMETVRLDYQSAFHFVLQRRFCVNPNEGFKLQLKEYEPIFSAKAQLSNASVMDAERLRLKRRTAPSDEVESESMDMQ